MLFASLKRGVLAGGVAGIAYGLFIAFFANPLISLIEHSQHGHSHAPEDAHVVAESTTAIVSVGSGLLWAVLLGGCFGIAYYLLEPALPGRGTGRPLVLAGSGFLTISVVPWLVLPPFAPGAVHVLSTDVRFMLYGALVVLGAAIAVGAVRIYKRLAPRSRTLGIAGGVLPVVTAILVIPTVSPSLVTHPTLSETAVAAYRAIVVVSQGSIWLLIAVTFSWLQRRTLFEATPTEPPQATS